MSASGKCRHSGDIEWEDGASGESEAGITEKYVIQRS